MTDAKKTEVQFQASTKTVTIGDGTSINDYRTMYQSDFLIAIDSSSLDDYKIFKDSNNGLLTIHSRLDWASWAILIVFFLANVISLGLAVKQATNIEKAMLLLEPLTGAIALMGVLVGYRISKLPTTRRMIQQNSDKGSEN